MYVYMRVMRIIVNRILREVKLKFLISSNYLCVLVCYTWSHQIYDLHIKRSIMGQHILNLSSSLTVV